MKLGYWGFFLLFFSSPGFPQDWPKQKPIQLIVGFAPGSTTDIVARLNAEIGRAFEAPDARERLAQQGLEWKRNTPTEFAVFLRSEIVKWARAVRESGAKAD